MNLPATGPNGAQYEIVHRTHRAVVTEVGATLRSYQVSDHDIVTPFGEQDPPAGCQGQHLLPWPNRIRDGRYHWAGTDHQLPITEPERHNAIHGLLNWVPWQMAELYRSHLRMRTVLRPQPGWPGTLTCDVWYALSQAGLSVEVRVTNSGSGDVPFGYAAHPYLRLGCPIDEARLSLPFTSYLDVDERLLPLAVRSGQPHKAGDLIGEARYDTAYTSPSRDESGRWHVTISSAGRWVGLWADEAFGWVQLYTPDDRLSLAVEPMTCAADAFNPGPTHDGLIVLAPGEEFRGHWGICSG